MTDLIISQESRATMVAIRGKLTVEQYLDAVWQHREAENPRHARPRWPWPIRMGVQAEIIPIRGRK